MRSRFTMVVTCAALLLLTACRRPEQPVARDESSDFDWARTALERNPQLEIVATDADAEVFTVRDKRTGEVLALNLDEIVAAPIAQLQKTAALAPAPAATETTETPETAPVPAAAASAPTSASTPTPPSGDERTAQTTAQQIDPSSPQPGQTPDQTPGYTIERTDGQLRVSGPGVSIVSSGNAAASASAPSGQRAINPIICEGRRMLQLDNRDIRVDGDAIIARGGCELHITNSRVVGSGAGVVIQDAVVHIVNSHVEGAAASFIANDGAKLYLRNSTFQGLSRRGEAATVQDQGGNRWK